MTNNLIIQKRDGSVDNILNFIKNSGGKICLVSMSRSYEFLKTEMKKRGIVEGNVFIIDCISRSLFFQTQEVADASFLHIQLDIKDFLPDLSSKMEASGDFKIFIFDSLSDLKRHWNSSPDTIPDFSKSLFPVLSKLGADSYFIMHEEDKESCTEQVISAFDGAYHSFGKDEKFEVKK